MKLSSSLGGAALGFLLFPSPLAIPNALAQPTTVIGWGLNENRQLIAPAGLTDAVRVAAGFRYSLAVRANGLVVGWGNSAQDPPMVPAGLNGVVDLASEGGRNLALRRNGTVVAWSHFEPDLGQRVPTGLSNVIAIAETGIFSLALKSDSTVISWGNRTNVPAGLSNVIAIASGSDVSLAAKSDGTVVAWGAAGTPMAGFVPAGLSNVVAVAASHFDYSMALRSDGTVVTFGRSQGGVGPVPPGLTNVVAIAANSLFSLALKADGTVTAWGQNDSGQTTVPSNVTNAIAIAAGFAHSLAIVEATPAAWPRITHQPQSTRAFVASTMTFRVEATAAAPLSFHWQHRGRDLPGQTNDTLVLTDLEFTHSGDYAVIVSAGGLSVRSAPAFLAVTLPPQALPESSLGLEDTDLVIELEGFDPNDLAFVPRIAQLPSAGRLFQFTQNGRGEAIETVPTTVTDLDGRVIYVPNANGHGEGYDHFLFIVSNELGDSAPGTVSIDLVPVNDAPVAVALVSSATPFAVPGLEGLNVIAPDNLNGQVIFDGEFSSDVEGDPLLFFWWEDGSVVPFASGVRVTNFVAVGEHSIRLQVSDGKASGWAAVTLAVITPGDATRILQEIVTDANLKREDKRPLLAALKTVAASLDRGHRQEGLRQLDAFEKKVAIRVSGDIANVLRQGAEQIRLAVEMGMNGKPPSHGPKPPSHSRDNLR